MASYWNQLQLFWKDINGQVATSFVTIQDQADNVPSDLLDLAAKYQALSDAKIVACQYVTTHQFAGAPLTGSYPTVWDRAQFNTMMAVTGARSRVEVVGPKAGIFLPGNVLVDMSLTVVNDFVNTLKNVAGDRDGNPILDVKQGRRKRVNVPPA